MQSARAGCWSAAAAPAAGGARLPPQQPGRLPTSDSPVLDPLAGQLRRPTCTSLHGRFCTGGKAARQRAGRSTCSRLLGRSSSVSAPPASTTAQRARLATSSLRMAAADRVQWVVWSAMQGPRVEMFVGHVSLGRACMGGPKAPNSPIAAAASIAGDAGLNRAPHEAVGARSKQSLCASLHKRFRATVQPRLDSGSTVQALPAPARRGKHGAPGPHPGRASASC